jgi:hypothetical protein
MMELEDQAKQVTSSLFYTRDSQSAAMGQMRPLTSLYAALWTPLKKNLHKMCVFFAL